MKKLKRMLCILLAALLLALIGAVTVSAQEPAQPDMEELHQKFIAYLDEQGVEHVDENGDELSSVAFIVNSNGWNIFKGIVWPVTDMPAKENIGRYVFYSMSGYHPYDIGVYAEKDGKIFSICKAYMQGAIDIDEIACYLLNSKLDNIDIGIRLIGDTDADNKITVNDVLNVQKTIAKLIYGVEDVFSDLDYNQDREINVKDVLDMQKMIAKVAE